METAEKLARDAIEGVGDATLGEWKHVLTAVHIRRRLSIAEQVKSALSVVDLRGTPEGKERMRKLIEQVPYIKQQAIRVGEWP